jgi:hypothetical protein
MQLFGNHNQIAQVAQLEVHMPNLSLQPNFELDMNVAGLIANNNNKIAEHLARTFWWELGIEATSPATAERPSVGRSCRLVEGLLMGIEYHEIGKGQILCQIRPAAPLMDRHQDCEIA